MKRFLGLVAVLTLGMALWSGPAWGQEGGATSSTGATSVGVNPIRAAFSGVRTVLSQLEVPSPLRALLTVIGDQVGALEADLASLYDDLFIETCPTCE